MMDSIENWVAKDSFMENMKFLDFPMESVEENAYEEEGDWIENLQADQALGPIPFEFLSRYVNKNFDGDFGTSNEDAPQLKKDGDGYESEVLFQPNSPISIFDNSNSGPIEKKLHIPFGTHIPRWARTKRSRASKINKWSFISPIISSTRSNHSNSSNIVKNAIQGENKMPCGNKIEKKFTHAVFLKRCSHCQVTKTPQWREGPMGPKTLCNACGVRYRSGRLFPEYCPRASPVFVPSLHSNSHKKVMEMRNKAS